MASLVELLRTLGPVEAAGLLLLENVIIFAAALAAGSVMVRLFRDRPVGPPPPPLEVREIGYAASAVALNTVVTLAGLWLWRMGIVHFREDTGLRAWLDVPVLLLVMDAAMYALHRVAHVPWIYRWIHQPHHRYDRPRPLTLFVLSPLETLGFGSLWLVVIIAYATSWLGMGVYLALNVAFGVLGHLNVEPFGRRFATLPAVRHLGTSTFHALHHQDPDHNFGFYTLIWDRVFGTLSPRYGVALSMIALVAAMLLAAAPASPEIHFSQVHAHDRTAARDHPDAIDRKMAAYIAAARQTLDVAVFELDNERVTDALVAAHRKGVRVRIVSDTMYEDERRADHGSYTQLKAAGVPIVFDGRSRYMHHKFLVRDAACVWTGSFNPVDSEAWENHNNAIELCSKELASRYTARFEQMFTGRAFGLSGAPSPTNAPLAVGSMQVETCFSPTDGCGRMIADRLASAKKKVRVMAFSISDFVPRGPETLAARMTMPTMKSALLDLKRAGVDVKVVVEKGKAFASGSVTRALLEAGVPVHTDTNPAILHHKVIILDDRVTITGSFNYSAEADGGNDENVVIVTDPRVAARYDAELQRIFDRGTPAKAPPDCSDGPPLDINLASTTDLTKLPGLGPKGASQIRDARPFDSVDDLVTRRLLSAAKLENLRACLTVGGASEPAGGAAAAYFSPGTAGHAAVASLVEQATGTIDIAMYSLSAGLVAMWRPLVERVRQGVACRVVLNDAPKGGLNAATELTRAGCKVRFVAGTMHHKYSIIDGRHVTTGSANWSVGAGRYSENTITYSGFPDVARDYSREFDTLWARAVDFPPPAGRIKYPPRVPGPGRADAATGGIQNLFTSQNSAGSALLNDALIASIDGSKRTLDIAVAHFDTGAIAERVCAAKQRGVDARVVTDLGEYALGASKVKALEACGVPVRYKVYGLVWQYSRAQLMHHKFLIADRATLATGSYNWSDTAERENAENLQVIAGGTPAGDALLEAFQSEFDALWELNRSKAPALVQAFSTAPPANKCQPIHFDTPYLRLVIALTRDELKAIRTRALRAGLHDREKATSSCVDLKTGAFLDKVPQGEPYVPGLSAP